MKTNLLPRLYALAMSAFLATVTTAGLAVMMAASGEHAKAEFGTSAAARQAAQPAAPALTRWHAPPADAQRVS